MFWLVSGWVGEESVDVCDVVILCEDGVRCELSR